VIHPNLRGYPPSEIGPNLFRVGMAVDVLNLIALIKDQGSLPGPLEAARNDDIGLWGHSMGGGIALRAATVNRDIKAVFLYSSMSGDEWQNYAEIFTRSGGTTGYDELLVPQDEIQRISPINYLDRIQAAISIHHGESDVQVPLQWSLDLCQRLQDLGKQVECYTYPGQPHSFNAVGGDLLMSRAIDFFGRFLK
jgi:dipeptidyl aminopeptidase/acylaminoacyl peptidase